MYNNLNYDTIQKIKDLGLYGLTEKEIIKTAINDIVEINKLFSTEDNKNSQQIKQALNKIQETLLKQYMDLI